MNNFFALLLFLFILFSLLSNLLSSEDILFDKDFDKINGNCCSIWGIFLIIKE